MVTYVQFSETLFSDPNILLSFLMTEKKLVSVTGKRDEGQKSKFEGRETKEGKENLKEKIQRQSCDLLIL